MDQPHGHKALAYRGGDPLDRAAAHVTRREHPRQARLQQVRLSRKSLPSLSLKRRTVQRSPRPELLRSGALAGWLLSKNRTFALTPCA